MRRLYESCASFSFSQTSTVVLVNTLNNAGHTAAIAFHSEVQDEHAFPAETGRLQPSLLHDITTSRLHPGTPPLPPHRPPPQGLLLHGQRRHAAEHYQSAVIRQPATADRSRHDGGRFSTTIITATFARIPLKLSIDRQELLLLLLRRLPQFFGQLFEAVTVGLTRRGAGSGELPWPGEKLRRRYALVGR